MRFTLLLLSILCFNISRSQNIGINNIDRQTIELENTERILLDKLPFNSIKVIDKRFDTTAIGYIKYGKSLEKTYKLVTKNSFEVDLQSFLNKENRNILNDSSKQNLVIVLRKFWFNRNYDNADYESTHNVFFSLTLSIDFLIEENGEYTPVVKKDTAIKVAKKRDSPEEGLIIGYSIEHYLANIGISKAANSSSKRKKYSYNQIDAYYRKRMEIPILIDSLKKGVYKDFEEFRKNHPSRDQFQIQDNKLSTNIYVVEGKDTVSLRDIWGYCDGKKIFIKCGLKCYELIRQGNTYAFFGSNKFTHVIYKTMGVQDTNRPITDLTVGVVTSLLLDRNKYKIELTPLVLDMESGDIY